MKYLNKYEDFVTYKVEDGYKKDIDLKDLEKQINTHCKDFKWSDEPIYRGMWANDIFNLTDVMIIDPSIKERRSENTGNYYTWIIDNSPAYKDYPKRSRSLICTNDDITAATFGDDECWRVIPFDGAKIGVCSSLDLWGSFPVLEKTFKSSYYQLDDFNNHLEHLYQVMFGEIVEVSWLKKPRQEYSDDSSYFGRPKSAEEFFETLDNLLAELEIIKNEPNGLDKLKENSLNPEWLNLDFVRNLPTTIEGVMDLFDPKKNGIKLMDYKDWAKNAPSDVECWIGSKCILVHQDIAAILEWRSNKKEDVYKDIEKLSVKNTWELK